MHLSLMNYMHLSLMDYMHLSLMDYMHLSLMNYMHLPSAQFGIQPHTKVNPSPNPTCFSHPDANLNHAVPASASNPESTRALSCPLAWQDSFPLS